MQPLIDGQTRQRVRTVRISQIEDHQTTGTTGDITQVGERTADETSWITLAMPGRARAGHGSSGIQAWSSPFRERSAGTGRKGRP